MKKFPKQIFVNIDEDDILLAWETASGMFNGNGDDGDKVRGARYGLIEEVIVERTTTVHPSRSRARKGEP